MCVVLNINFSSEVQNEFEQETRPTETVSPRDIWDNMCKDIPISSSC